MKGISFTAGHMDDLDIRVKIQAWFGLSRPPFHTVGVLPFLLGGFLSWRINGIFDATIFALEVIAVVLIMLSTYHAGEYFDHEEDRVSKQLFNSRFAGGSGVIPSGILSRQIPLWTSLISLNGCRRYSVILQFVLETGPYTLILGCLGTFPVFFIPQDRSGSWKGDSENFSSASVMDGFPSRPLFIFRQAIFTP
ncbi:MAG: hypothetical protein NTZ24_04095 [Deltaproteobacteria bacterium]|nr:hypothetical protein [Deltaproteobacteria bacterium]